MPAGNFDQTPTRFPAVCTASASRSSTPLSEWLGLRIWRNGKEHYMRFSYGEPEAPLKVVGDANGKRGTEVTFLPSPKTFTKTEFDFATLEQSLARTGVLEYRASPSSSWTIRGVEKKDTLLHYDGGLEES